MLGSESAPASQARLFDISQRKQVLFLQYMEFTLPLDTIHHRLPYTWISWSEKDKVDYNLKDRNVRGESSFSLRYWFEI